tara:strand:- start:3490 stop:3594 length:105 start_codon:yes stop_codon:yes gene_type:complete
LILQLKVYPNYFEAVDELQYLNSKTKEVLNMIEV